MIPLPEYAAALGDIYAKLGRPAEAKQQYALVEYIARLNALNRTVYNRELVYFYADHGIKQVEALDLARREIELRKDIYGYDALAWALYSSGQAEEALAPIMEALRLGTRDARLFLHAGMIASEARQDRAGDPMARANPGPPIPTFISFRPRWRALL